MLCRSVILNKKNVKSSEELIISITTFLLILFSCIHAFAADTREQGSLFSFKPKGSLKLDYLRIKNNRLNLKDRYYIRDLLIGGKGQILRDFDYRFDINVIGDMYSRINQAYIEYKKYNPVSIKVGRMFHSFFLDYDKSFNEWPAIGTLVIQVKDGVQVKTHGSNWSVTGSYGMSETVYNNNADRRNSLYAQVTYSPYYNEKKQEYLHLGLANSYIMPKESLKYKIKPEANANFSLLNTGTISSVKNAFITGISAAYNNKEFSTQVEYLGCHIDREMAKPSLFFHGGYAQVGYFLTGESKEYNPSKGRIESVVPLDPVFTSKNYKKIGIGAWEIAVKYSVANLNSKTKFGKLLTYGLGLNWYLNENIKLSNDFLISRTDKFAAVPNSISKIVLVRLQIEL